MKKSNIIDYPGTYTDFDGETPVNFGRDVVDRREEEEGPAKIWPITDRTERSPDFAYLSRLLNRFPTLRGRLA